MGASWWVHCWRWIMRIQVVVVVVGLAIGKVMGPKLDWRMVTSWDLAQATLGQALIADAFMLAAFVSFALMFFTAPIWILAEGLDWRRRERDRRELRSIDRQRVAHRRGD